MKNSIRKLVLVLVGSQLLAPLTVHADDHITCSLDGPGIPQQTNPGTIYISSYLCKNTNPSTFPSIQLVGNIVGDASISRLKGSCTTTKISSGGSCRFNLSYTPLNQGSHNFYIEVSVGSQYYFKLPVSTDSSGRPTDVPYKTIIIYNNNPGSGLEHAKKKSGTDTIYPVIEVPILTKDSWLQAQFGELNVATNTYAQSRVHRIYVNGINGITAGSYATIQVPFYSQLVNTTPNPSQPDQYIDWWNAARVYIYDDAAAILTNHNNDVNRSGNPVTPFTSGPSCIEGSCSNLSIYYDTVSLPLYDPYQLTEYTFANVVTGHGAPYPIDKNYVDYDISYVDQVYLPVAMEPYPNVQLIGYTGTAMDLNTFRTKLTNFMTDAGWPKYSTVTSPRLPGTYNITLNNQPLTANSILSTLTNNWDTCKVVANSDCAKVKDLFDKNSANYQTLCSASAPTAEEYIQHLYGWVAFTCDGVTNDLANTPSANYSEAVKSYHALQYNYQSILNIPLQFNPYVGLIHSSTYLGMNAYAYSIDDAVGNMNQLGEGLVLAVGGNQNLPVSTPFDPSTVVTVNLGAPPAGVTWVSYGVCANPNINFAPGTFSFQVFKAPCNITVLDSNNNRYQFTLKQLAPFTGSDKSVYVGCNSNDTWCNGINVDFNTGHDIDAPAPV